MISNNHTTQTEQAQQRATSSRNDGIVTATATNNPYPLLDMVKGSRGQNSDNGLMMVGGVDNRDTLKRGWNSSNGMIMVGGVDNRHTLNRCDNHNSSINHQGNLDNSRNNDYRYTLKALLHGVPHLKCGIKNYLDTCLHGHNDHLANTLHCENNNTAKRNPYSILSMVITADKGYFFQSIKRGGFEFCESIKREFREQYAHAQKGVSRPVRTCSENLSKLDVQNPTKPNIKRVPQNKATFKNDNADSNELKNTLTSSNHRGYYKDLSKTISGLSNRYKLTFFVPKVCLASQVIKRLSTKQFTQYLLLQGKTVISMVSNLSPSYNGLTLQNTIAFRRICRAVTNSTESKTRYPMFFHSVALTQKLLGGL